MYIIKRWSRGLWDHGEEKDLYLGEARGSVAIEIRKGEGGVICLCGYLFFVLFGLGWEKRQSRGPQLWRRDFGERDRGRACLGYLIMRRNSLFGVFWVNYAKTRFNGERAGFFFHFDNGTSHRAYSDFTSYRGPCACVCAVLSNV